MNERDRVRVVVGQVWEDSYLSSDKAGPHLVRVMKLNRKSARVEPCDAGGNTEGFFYQYRMEYEHFDRGRMVLVGDDLRRQCAHLGHDYDVLAEWGIGEPYELFCKRCGRSWPIGSGVAAGEDPHVSGANKGHDTPGGTL